MVEIQASPVLPDENHHTEARRDVQRASRSLNIAAPLDVQNEKGVAMSDLHEITLTAEWTSSDGARAFQFTVAFDLLRGRGLTAWLAESFQAPLLPTFESVCPHIPHPLTLA